MIRSEKALTLIGNSLDSLDGSGSADTFDHLTRAAAVLAFPIIESTATVANPADVFPSAGSPRDCVIPGIFGG